MPEYPLLDSAHLTEIASLEPFKPGLRQQMLVLFEDSSRTCLVQCRAGAKARDAAALKAAAHRLKGSATSLGAPRLRALATTLEADAESGRVDTAPALLEQTETVLDQTLDAYRHWLSA